MKTKKLNTGTDWDEIKQHIENKKNFDNLIVGRNLPKEFCKAVATNLADRESMSSKIDAISGIVSKVKELEPFFVKIFGIEIANSSIDALAEKYRRNTQ